MYFCYLVWTVLVVRRMFRLHDFRQLQGHHDRADSLDVPDD